MNFTILLSKQSLRTSKMAASNTSSDARSTEVPPFSLAIGRELPYRILIRLKTAACQENGFTTSCIASAVIGQLPGREDRPQQGLISVRREECSTEAQTDFILSSSTNSSFK